VVKKGILDSTKGPFGGFSLNDKTMNTSLLLLLRTVDGLHPFNSCVLMMKKCNDSQSCPLHEKTAHIRDSFYAVFAHTTIGDLKRGTKTGPTKKHCRLLILCGKK
jgi:DNA-binding IscR family transcriptional regulator